MTLRDARGTVRGTVRKQSIMGYYGKSL